MTYRADPMQNAKEPLLAAAQRLHTFVCDQHWNGQTISGPDLGIRFNSRIGRFVKSYLRFLPWRDDIAYMQGQGYWILANWTLDELLETGPYRQIACDCSQHVLAAQREDGGWDYPNREWKGRLATVEGCFAALGLLETYARTGVEPCLNAVKKYYRHLVEDVGFRGQSRKGMLAVNYFAHETGDGGGVPNNATLAMWLLARLAEVSGDDEYLTYCRPMAAWLRHVQLPSGELPYALGATPDKHRPHFLCYQYNAFEFMDLAHYHRITGDEEILPVAQGMAEYLARGLTPDGAARFNCHKDAPEVTYYGAAVAAAVSQAAALGMIHEPDAVQRAFQRVVSHQTPEGGFQFFSRDNYRVLCDRRSYPRFLAMILLHLLQQHQLVRHGRSTPGSDVPATTEVTS